MTPLTTASTAIPLPFRENRFAQRLACLMGAVILITGTTPEKAFDWWLENAAALSFLAILAITYRRLTFSDTSYALIFLFLALHEWGAQYKYSDVPLGEWVKPLLGTSRNHYDRIMHFNYGFLLGYPMQEWIMRSAGVWSRWRYVLPVAMVLAFSATYEILEAFMASILSPERGEEFVGMQGDFWDAQKDMTLAALGAIITMLAVAAARAWRAKSARAQSAYAERKTGTGR
jgi:putative membrane protein